MGVYQFDNPFGLTQVDQSSFIESDLSGQPIVYKENDSEKPPYQLKQSALESSNVDLTDQMADLIVTQRAYQVNAKIVQTGDNIEEIINNLRQ